MSINPTYSWALVMTLAVAVVALAVNLQLAVFFGIFAIFAWWSWLNPILAIYLLIVVAPLLPMFKITQTVGSITLIKDVIILTLVTKLVLWPLITKRLPYRRNILLAPLALLVLWVVLTALRADSLVLGILRARDILLYPLLYMAVLYLSESKRWYKEAAGWFLASVAIVAVLGYYQFFFLPESSVLRFDPARHIWIPRVSSIMAHPSIFGQYLVTSSTLLAAVLLGSGRLLDQRKKIAIGALFLFLVPLVYLTYSRAVWLGYLGGLGAMGAVYLWAKVRAATAFRVPWRMAVAGLATVLILVGLAVQFTSLGVFVRSAFDPTYGSNAVRLEFLARLVAPVTPGAALFGAGLGDVVAQNFRTADVTTFDIASGASRAVQLAKDVTLVDNQYLKTFIEMGLVGLLIYAWLYWRVVRGSWLLATSYLPVRQAGKLPATVIGLWSIGFLTAFLIQAFFIDIWDIFPTNLAFWIIAALVSSEQTPYTEEHK